MGRYLLRRLASAVVTLWILATIVFLMVNVIPGNVGRSVLGPFAIKEDVAVAWALSPVFESGGREALRVEIASGKGPGAIAAAGVDAILKRPPP